MRGENKKFGSKDQSPYNLVVLGDAKSGKTTFVSQCIGLADCMNTSYKPTIEDSYRTLTQLPDGKFKTVNMVDTAGSMEFPAMRELRIRSATAVIIVYSIGNTNSTAMASTLKKQVQQMREYDGVPIIVIGNRRSTDVGSAYQEPAGIKEDSSCKHFTKDLSDKKECIEIFDCVIRECYVSNSWQVEVWAKNPHQNNAKKASKRKSLFSYLSFRKRKSFRQPGRSKTTKSLP